MVYPWFGRSVDVGLKIDNDKLSEWYKLFNRHNLRHGESRSSVKDDFGDAANVISVFVWNQPINGLFNYEGASDLLNQRFYIVYFKTGDFSVFIYDKEWIESKTGESEFHSS